MILSDRDLLARLHASGEPIISPLRNPSLQIQPASIDVCLGNSFTSSIEGVTSEIDPFDADTFLTQTWEEDGPYIVVEPRQFLLGTTEEVIRVPDDLVARLDGRSTYGRHGIIIHATAGYIDPGFKGQVTLEIYNLGSRPVRLHIGERIGQVVFTTMTSPAVRPYGGTTSKYMHQQGATAPKPDISIHQPISHLRGPNHG